MPSQSCSQADGQSLAVGRGQQRASRGHRVESSGRGGRSGEVARARLSITLHLLEKVEASITLLPPPKLSIGALYSNSELHVAEAAQERRATGRWNLESCHAQLGAGDPLVRRSERRTTFLYQLHRGPSGVSYRVRSLRGDGMRKTGGGGYKARWRYGYAGRERRARPERGIQYECRDTETRLKSSRTGRCGP